MLMAATWLGKQRQPVAFSESWDATWFSSALAPHTGPELVSAFAVEPEVLLDLPALSAADT